MLGFGKVNKIKATKDEKGNVTSYGTEYAKGSQKDYEKKVKDFFKYCQEFDKELKELQPKEGKVITAKDIKDCFNKSFNGYYSKLSKRLSLFSRTTRVLKEMDKKLKKLGNLEINLENDSVAKLRDAFEYKREMPTGKLIKRSTIDDKVIYGFFNGTVPKIIRGLVEKAEKNAEQVTAEKELKFIESSLENAKFENRFKVLVDKIGEINKDLERIKEEENEYGEDEEAEKAFKKNDNFIVKIREEVKKVKGKIDDSGNKFKEEKGNLKKYKESTEDEKKKFGFSESECKKTIRNIKNDVEQYSKEVKKLKSDTEKAEKEFNKIVSKLENDKNFLDSLFKLDDYVLTITGNRGVKAYCDDYRSDLGKYRDYVKTVYMYNVSDINSSFGSKNGICNGFQYLKSVTAKNLSGKICDYAFYGCKNLASFNKEGNSRDYNIPVSVNEIGERAFFEAGSEVADGFSANMAGVKTIGDYAFFGSGLKEINLPNVTAIGLRAFRSCSNLKKVILGPNIKAEKIDNDAFDNTGDLIIYVKNAGLQEKLQERFEGSGITVEMITRPRTMPII